MIVASQPAGRSEQCRPASGVRHLARTPPSGLRRGQLRHRTDDLRLDFSVRHAASAYPARRAARLLPGGRHVHHAEYRPARRIANQVHPLAIPVIVQMPALHRIRRTIGIE